MANPSDTTAGAADRSALFEATQGRAGYFSTRQGAAAGYSSQLLAQTRQRGLITAKTEVRLLKGLSGRSRERIQR